MDDLSVSLFIAIASALVGLLCAGLALAAMLRIVKVRKGKGPVGETPADLKKFALNQTLSAVVMFALAAIIVVFS